MTTPLVLVAGTHGLRDYEQLEKLEARAMLAELPWWHPRSAFADQARAHSLQLVDDVRPFLWSTDLDGLAGSHTTWYAAGWALVYYAAAHQVQELDVVAHSHGGQVAAFAACYAPLYGIRIRRLLTICTPVRRDMQRVRRRARGSVKGWYHAWSDGDVWQEAGELADGQLGGGNAMPEPGTVNLFFSEYRHTGLLEDLGAFERTGLWNVLRAG